MRWSSFKQAACLAVFVSVPVITSCTMYEDMQALKKPRYELGTQKGAKYCGSCHKEIYEQWSKRSRHAIATSAKSFRDFKDKFTGSVLLNSIMGQSMCYACHGSKEVNEGVNCETCHGTVIPNVSILETHEKKYKPGRQTLKKPEFCARCHTLKNPLSGDMVIATYNEWKESKAAAQGTTCQDCHMASRTGKLLYHGFDTAVLDAGMYRNDLRISDIKLEFPRFSLVIENRLTAHAIPVGGPARILGLEIALLDATNNELYKMQRTFAKRFDLMPIAGIMPYRLIENTRLQSGEERTVDFLIPPAFKGKIAKAHIKLRMYEVSDEHQGNIEKAHWTGEPILEKEVSF
jgi:hypothetical protein